MHIAINHVRPIIIRITEFNIILSQLLPVVRFPSIHQPFFKSFSLTILDPGFN